MIDICDIEQILKERYKINPVDIRPWRDHIIISKNQAGILNETSTWRFSGDIQVGGTASDEYDFPFFIGELNFNVYKSDVNQVDVANYWLIVNLFSLTSCIGSYVTQPDQLKMYAAGIYLGPPLPAAGFNEIAENLNNPHKIVAPFIQVQAFTDATGDIETYVSMSFEGYKIFMS